MKRIISLIGLLALVSAGLFAQGKEYKVGDVGPAGGFVFYDKGEFSDGWRYLEAAPVETEFKAEWGGINKNCPDTFTDIGKGKENTDIIIMHLERIKNEKIRNRAAQLCADLEFGGFDDWFLPSKDELDLIFKNLKEKELGGFKNETYWSSSQASRREGWSQAFGVSIMFVPLPPGIQSAKMKYENCFVRAIRAF